MSALFWNNRRIRMNRGDALGGALPLVVMYSDSLADMRVGSRKRTRRSKKSRYTSFNRFLISLAVCGIGAAIVFALLLEGPKV